MIELPECDRSTFTLPEIVSYVCRVTKCSAEVAEDEIRAMLGESLEPLYWQDRKNIDHYPPEPGPIWRSADIDWETGGVSLDGAPRRVLLVHKNAATMRWLDKTPEEIAAAGNLTNDTDYSRYLLASAKKGAVLIRGTVS